jgi:hypothetical protein
MTKDAPTRPAPRRNARTLAADVERLTGELETAVAEKLAAEQRADTAESMAQAKAEGAIRRAERQTDAARRDGQSQTAEVQARLDVALQQVEDANRLRDRAIEEGRSISNRLQAATNFISLFDISDQRRMQAALALAETELNRRREILAETTSEAHRQAEEILTAARNQAAAELERAREAVASEQAAADSIAAEVAEIRRRAVTDAAAEAEHLRAQGQRAIDAARAGVAEGERLRQKAAEDARAIAEATTRAKAALARLSEQTDAAVAASPDAQLYLHYGLFAGMDDTASALAANRARQADMLAAGTALTGTNGDPELAQLAAVVLRGYNAEVEATMHAVTTVGVATAVKRLVRAKTAIAELGLLAIAPEYHTLRVQEVEMVSRQGV